MSRRTQIVLAALVLAAHLSLSYSHNFLVSADDDRLWLYTTAVGLSQPELTADLNARIAKALQAPEARASQGYRFALREGYQRNYVGATALYAAVISALKRWTGPTWRTDYPAYLACALYTAFVAMYLLTCLAMLGLVLAADERWLAAAVLAVAVNAGLESIFDLFGDRWFGLPTLLPNAGTTQTMAETLWPNLPALFVNPQIQLSPFGDTPRNHFILMMVPLFLLRWRGHLAASYALLAALGFMHQSHTGLLLLILVAADVLLRPALFRSSVALVAGATLLMFVGRESLGNVIGVARPPVVAAMACAAIGAAVCLYFGLRGRVSGAADRLARLRDRLLALGPVGADGVVIGAMLVGSFPFVVLVNSMGTEAQSIYFWTQVHGRTLGILRPALLLGLAWWAVARLDASRGRKRALVLAYAVALAGLVPSAIEATRHDRHPIVRITGQTRALERAIGPGVDWTTIASRSETETYFALARALDLPR